jgi:predicted CoA-binding protein
MTSDSEATSRIGAFLSGASYAVVGASKERAKYGNKVLRNYVQAEIPVVAVHPRESSIEGVPCVASIDALPPDVFGLSVVTPPGMAVAVVEAAARKGIRHVWFQPGASSPEAVVRARTGAELPSPRGRACCRAALSARIDLRSDRDRVENPRDDREPLVMNRPTPSSVFDSRFLFGWSPV